MWVLILIAFPCSLDMVNVGDHGAACCHLDQESLSTPALTSLPTVAQYTSKYTDARRRHRLFFHVIFAVVPVPPWLKKQR
ncbi:hypothetical protein B0F90DRAFT_1752338 [Multifurca ochricompacta]|uniref:Secreted protein n=1 Tax=Multifurca ochricompacta TaxID=376703 RepID=A0AAD4LZ56_9AGAM|nr:hypothetical protein B0F90DRAFT_1752338 [Multifurca ochricompacta]